MEQNTASETVYLSSSTSYPLELESDLYPYDPNNTNSSLFWINIPPRHSPEISVALIIAYSIVFVTGAIGNTLVILVMIRSKKMCTVTNSFLLNLAIADLLVTLFCIPCTLLANLFLPWILGKVMCKAVAYAQGVSVCASVYSLVAVSFDRFLAIRYPLKPQLHITKPKAKLIISLIWLFSLLATIPWIFVFNTVTVNSIEICLESWPNETLGKVYFVIVDLFLYYLLPFGLITYCYSLIWLRVLKRNIPRSKSSSSSSPNNSSPSFQHMKRIHRRTKISVLKMLTIVISVFLISWLPFYIIFTWLKFISDMRNLSSKEERSLSIVTPMAQWLGSSNSCINPILYNFLDKRFRNGFKEIFTVAFTRKKKLQQSSLSLRGSR